MKKIFLFATITCLLSACSSPTKRANELIDQWMSENMPTTEYKPASILKSIDFTVEELAHIQSLEIKLDSAMTFQIITLNPEVETTEGLSEFAEAMKASLAEANEKIEQAAMERAWAIEEEIDSYKANHQRKEEGEKGYTAFVSCTINGQPTGITFYLNSEIDKIERVDKP